jgi:uncharacterized protein
MMAFNPMLIVAGFSIGALIGLTGVGGGSLMTPFLVAIGLNPMLAVGTDLLFNLPTKLFAWVVHRRQGTIRTDVLKWLCIGGVPAAVAGLALLAVINRYVDMKTIDDWTKHGIGIAIIISAALIIVSPFILRGRQNTNENGTLRRGRVAIIGAIVGLMVSLTSIGGGAVALPLLVLCLPGVSLAEMVGSDIAFSAILVLVSVTVHFRMGHVDVPIAVQLMAGSLVGIYLGSRLCGILHQRWLRPALAVVLVLAGSRLI